MLKGKERQMVLDYLYQDCISKTNDPFVTRIKMTCKIESQLRYEHISYKEKIQIYNQIINKKILDYIEGKIPDVDHSATISSLSTAEKIAICEKLGFKYMNN